MQHQTAEQRQDFLRTSNYGRCAYDVDNDAVDHQVVAFEFAGGATATFTMTAFAPGGRKLRVHGTHGFIKAKVDENKIELHRFWGEAGHGASNGDTANPYTTVDAVYDKPQQIEVPKAEGGHGGGDPNVIKSLIRAIRTDDRSAVMTGTNESLKTHAVTFAAEMARRQRCVVEVMQLQTAVRAEMAGRAR